MMFYGTFTLIASEEIQPFFDIKDSLQHVEAIPALG